MAYEKINPAEQLAATGTPSATTYLRGDNSWNTPSGGTSGSTTPTANTAAEWDSNLNLSANAVLEGFTSTATSSTTLTLTIASHPVQAFTTGTANQIVTLPTTSVPVGTQFLLVNLSTFTVTVNASGGTTAVTLAAGTSAVVTANSATPTTPSGWDVQYGGIAVTTGKVLNVSNTMTLSATDGASVNLSNFPVANLGGGTTIAATQAITTATTQTVIASMAIPASTLLAGDTFKLKVFATQSTSSTVTYQIRIGTHNTSADTSVCSVVQAVGTGATGAAHFDGLLTVRTTGASGTCIASGIAYGSTTPVISTATATVAISTTVQNYVSVSVANSAGTHTIQTAFVSWAQA
jgi:hypothetical protein